MAAIFQIRRGTTNVSLTEGELYLHQISGSLQFGSGSGTYNVLTLDAPSYGNIDLNGNISASGDIRIGGNLYLGNQTSDTISALGQFTTNLVPNGTIDVGTPSAKWNNIFANGLSGSIAATNGVVSGSSQLSTAFEAIASNTHTIISGSSQIISILDSLNTFSASILTETASLETRATTLKTYTASVETRFTTLGTLTGSNSIRLSNLESKSASVDTQLSTLGTETASLETRMITLANVTSSIHSYTSSLKTAFDFTGSNVVIKGNLTVQGTTTQIDSTTLNIGDNIIQLNGSSVANAGLQVKDPTGTTTSGSLLWDSSLDYWKAGALGSETKVLLAGGDSVISSSMQLTQLNSFTASVTSSLVSIYQTTSSLNLFSASVTSSLVSIYQTTSSLNSWSASAKIELSNLESKSASVDISILNINSETASLETRATTLANVTSSLNTFTSSANIRLNNLESFSGSQLTQNGVLATLTGSLIISASAVSSSVWALNKFSASTLNNIVDLYWTASNHESRLDYVEGVAFGGIDLNAQFMALEIVTSSLQNATASIQTWSASARVELSNLESTTASLNTSISNINSTTASLNVSVTNLNLATSSYETKGRGIVSGSSQIVSLLPTGTISGSSQVVYASISSIPSGIVSGSSQITYANISSIPSGIVSGAVQVTALLPTGTVSGSSQILGGSTIMSGSSGNYQFNSIGIGTAGSGVTGELRATGDIVAYYSSDERLKENIQPIQNALTKVEAISGNTYDWKEGFETIHSHKGNDLGVIAQEVQSVLPEVVTERETGYLAVDYVKLVPVLIQAIKELSAKVKELENK